MRGRADLGEVPEYKALFQAGEEDKRREQLETPISEHAGGSEEQLMGR